MKKEYEHQAHQFSGEKLIRFMPKNFDHVNDKLYRGSWPETADFLVNLNITEVLTLYSSGDEKEAEQIIDLQKIIARANINHTIIDVKNNDDLWRAAQYIHESNISTYVHCQAGANRTSMVCLISQIMCLGPELASEALPRLISQAIGHGFDYHKEKYKIVLSDILAQAKQKGLLLNWFLP